MLSDTQNGANVTVTNMYYNGAIAPGASTNFGFLVNWNGTNNPRRHHLHHHLTT